MDNQTANFNHLQNEENKRLIGWPEPRPYSPEEEERLDVLYREFFESESITDSDERERVEYELIRKMFEVSNDNLCRTSSKSREELEDKFRRTYEDQMAYMMRKREEGVIYPALEELLSSRRGETPSEANDTA